MTTTMMLLLMMTSILHDADDKVVQRTNDGATLLKIMTWGCF